MEDARMGTERVGLWGFFRLVREMRRFAKLNARPVISADAARDRYEPLIRSLAAELPREFGVEFRPAEGSPSRRTRQIFESPRWVAGQPLHRFPEWHERLDAAVRRIADIVEPEEPEGPLPTREPAIDLGDDIEVMLLSERLSLRDRLGGDVRVVIDADQTSLSAIATVRPD